MLSLKAPLAPAAVFGALLAALLAAAPAAAIGGIGLSCGSDTCTIPGNDALEVNYTIPPDGRTWRWTFTYSDAAPGAIVRLSDPNQTDVNLTIRTADGFDYLYVPNPLFRFEETLVPGVRSSYLVKAPRAFDVCATPGPIGQICARDVQIWGNAAFLVNASSDPVTVTVSQALVPEPASWAMLLTGFALIGTAARRRTLSPS